VRNSESAAQVNSSRGVKIDTNLVERLAYQLAAARGCRPSRSGKLGFSTHCPAHDDRVPSLSIALGNKPDTMVFHCFVGCTFDEILRAIVERGWLPKSFQAEFKPSRLIRQVQKAAAHYRWTYPGGATDYAVLRVHITLASRTGDRNSYEAAICYVADLAGIAKPTTVSHSHRRLVRRGWLSRAGRREQLRGKRFRLRLPDYTHTQLGDQRGGGDQERAKLPTATYHVPFARSRSPGADLWFNRDGLGKAAYRVWMALNTVRPISTDTLTAALGYSDPHTLRRYLRLLRLHGLACVGPDGGWRRVDRDLSALATQMGVAGKGARLKRQREEQRERYRDVMIDKLAKKMHRAERERTACVNETTGEMFEPRGPRNGLTSTGADGMSSGKACPREDRGDDERLAS